MEKKIRILFSTLDDLKYNCGKGFDFINQRKNEGIGIIYDRKRSDKEGEFSRLEQIKKCNFIHYAEFTFTPGGIVKNPFDIR